MVLELLDKVMMVVVDTQVVLQPHLIPAAVAVVLNKQALMELTVKAVTAGLDIISVVYLEQV